MGPRSRTSRFFPCSLEKFQIAIAIEVWKCHAFGFSQRVHLQKRNISELHASRSTMMLIQLDYSSSIECPPRPSHTSVLPVYANPCSLKICTRRLKPIMNIHSVVSQCLLTVGIPRFPPLINTHVITAWALGKLHWIAYNRRTRGCTDIGWPNHIRSWMLVVFQEN